MSSLEVLFSPAEFAALPARDLSGAVCVVFDVLRATSSMITALANGAAGMIPVAEIGEALAVRQTTADILLAGERNGLRIGAAQTGGVDFDLGNSPREFTRERVLGKTIVTTTTNGTRALQSCARAKIVAAASFLNLSATASFVQRQMPANVLLICSGTFEETAYEDVLAAGAMCQLLSGQFADDQIADSAGIAHEVYGQAATNLLEALSRARNGRRLLSIPELKDDVAFCVQRDIFNIVAVMRDGVVKRIES
jgi:2-phosphosulfolactate phosphatase